MVVFCDTSALYAVGNRDDEAHEAAAEAWEAPIGGDRYRLVSTNYVVVETLHNAAVEDCLRTRRRGVSLVDCVGFAFDRHFTEYGLKPFTQSK